MSDTGIGDHTQIDIDPNTKATQFTAEQLVHRLWSAETIDGTTPMNGTTRKRIWQALLAKVSEGPKPSKNFVVQMDAAARMPIAAPLKDLEAAFSVEALSKATTSGLIGALAVIVQMEEPRKEHLERVNTEIDRRLPGPGSQLGVGFVPPRGDVDDQLATMAALLELTARTFAQRDALPPEEREVGDVGLGIARADLRRAAVAYAKAEQKFGVELQRMLGKDPR